MTTENNNQPLQPNGQGEVNVGQLSQITDLIYPRVQWEEDDYTDLQVRLDLYEHFTLMTDFKEGQPVAQQIVDPMLMASALSQISLTSGLLPANTLFWGKQHNAERLVIYLAPKVYTVSIRDLKIAWQIPLPGMVLVGHEYNYSLYALKTEPTSLNTPLFHAPCPNVHPEGVCRGNAPFPQAQGATIWRAVEIFFSSRFNQDLGQGKSKKYPANILEMWRDLNREEASAYPLDDLIPAHMNLGRLNHG